MKFKDTKPNKSRASRILKKFGTVNFENRSDSMHQTDMFTKNQVSVVTEVTGVTNSPPLANKKLKLVQQDKYVVMAAKQARNRVKSKRLSYARDMEELMASSFERKPT